MNTANFNALTVALDPGVTLVEASAGTGKTFAITRLLLRLLLERKVESLSQILVVTFTVKATQELVTRIRETLRAADQIWSDTPPAKTAKNADIFTLREQYGDAGRGIIAEAFASLDDLAVSTIHGFCQRVLTESALESGIPFRTTFIQDDTEPFGRAAKDWARQRLMHNPEAASQVANAKATSRDPDGWVRPLVLPYRQQANTRIDLDPESSDQRLLSDFVQTVDRAFTEEKARRHLLGFDDLLQRLSDVLQAEGAEGPLAQRIRSRFRAALIDEFQDTDRTQYPIFSLAFAGCPLFLIGDPKQSIFRFRGADIDAYLDAAECTDRQFTLRANYRSTAPLLSAVEQLFTRAPDPFMVPATRIGFPSVTAATTPPAPGGMATDGRAAMEWWWVPGSYGQKGFASKELAYDLVFGDVANEAIRLHNDGLPFGDMAVLVRTNAEARRVKSVLDGCRVPAVIGGDADVLESEEADELLRLAGAIAAPQDGRAVRAAMSTRLWGSDTDALRATLESDGDDAWRITAEQFRRARESWRYRGVAVAVGELMAARGSAARLLALPDGERRLTNLRHAIELAHEAWATDGVAPEALAAWMARERTVPNTPDRRELRLETDAASVQILTIHKAKGLEFAVVFCTTLWSAASPRQGPLDTTPALVRDEGQPVLDLGSPRNATRREAVQAQEQAEAMRLAYVALTRAVHRCYVAMGEIGTGQAWEQSALGYLLRPVAHESIWEELKALVDASAGAMRVSAVQEDTPLLRLKPTGPAPRRAAARVLSLARGQLHTWHATSFTKLTRDATGGTAAPSAGDSTDEADRDVADPTLVPDVSTAPATGFRRFPAGAGPGIALHALFEELDFRNTTPDTVTPLVRRTLARYGLVGDEVVAEERERDVVQMLHTVCAAPIPVADFRLADLSPSDALREWRFDLSLNTTAARVIAEVLASAGSAHAQAYAPALATLTESAVSGYLGGVVDLACEVNGRWWIVDYKSNRLGYHDADYAPEQLGLAMMRGHYTLQYHLYLLALHRHLRLRQPGYDPARHLGGAVYVFLRGVSSEAAVRENGWFVDVPSPALLEALDTALGTRS